MLNVAVIFDSNIKGGGGYYQSLKTVKLLNSIKNDKFNFIFYCTSHDVLKELNENLINSKIIKISFIENLLNYIDENSFLKKILKKIKFRNSLHKISSQKNIDLFFFLGPSKLIKLVKNSENSNFMVNIWDINHKLNNYFPEYKSIETYNEKENILKITVENSFKIIVNSKRALEDVIKIYNCEEKKISIIPFFTYLPEIFAKKNRDFFDAIFKNFALDYKKKTFFYPAKFWAHKNHIFLIEVAKELKKKNLNFQIVFTGSHEDGNYNFLKNKVQNNNLTSEIKFFYHLSEDQLISLYLNSSALLMPTYVARTTLPLLEALFFELPIFYSKDILDKEYALYVNEFDLNNKNHLVDLLTDFIKNDSFYKEKTLKGKLFYDQISDEKTNMMLFKKIFDEYFFLKSKWK